MEFDKNVKLGGIANTEEQGVLARKRWMGLEIEIKVN